MYFCLVFTLFFLVFIARSVTLELNPASLKQISGQFPNNELERQKLIKIKVTVVKAEVR